MSRCVFSLHNHTFPGHRDCLDYLIAKGANVNARTKVRHGLPSAYPWQCFGGEMTPHSAPAAAAPAQAGCFTACAVRALPPRFGSPCGRRYIGR